MNRALRKQNCKRSNSVFWFGAAAVAICSCAVSKLSDMPFYQAADVVTGGTSIASSLAITLTYSVLKDGVSERLAKVLRAAALVRRPQNVNRVLYMAVYTR